MVKILVNIGKGVIGLLMVAMLYMHTVTPNKKRHKQTKVNHRHGALKVVFGG